MKRYLIHAINNSLLLKSNICEEIGSTKNISDKRTDNLQVFVTHFLMSCVVWTISRSTDCRLRNTKVRNHPKSPEDFFSVIH